MGIPSLSIPNYSTPQLSIPGWPGVIAPVVTYLSHLFGYRRR